jgi:hypothetical protein
MGPSSDEKEQGKETIRPYYFACSKTLILASIFPYLWLGLQKT